MWEDRIVLKRIFTKTYNNAENIVDYITNTNHIYKNPKMFIGSEFIGGGIMGTKINIEHSIHNNVININVKNNQHIPKTTLHGRATNTVDGCVFKKNISGNMVQCFLFFQIVSVSFPFENKDNFYYCKLNGDIQKDGVNIEATWVQITSSPARFMNRVFMEVFLNNLKDGDTIEVGYNKIIRYVEYENITYNVNEIVEDGKNLPNKINVFVTE